MAAEAQQGLEYHCMTDVADHEVCIKVKQSVVLLHMLLFRKIDMSVHTIKV